MQCKHKLYYNVMLWICSVLISLLKRVLVHKAPTLWGIGEG
uniref:Uncharacterized protein n=1 Tax=Rhizophora mucronata TaxID=61149 RepID=A0A2P2Q7E1_RHIMU